MSVERSINNISVFVFAMLLQMPMIDTTLQPELFERSTETDIFNTKFTSLIGRFKVLRVSEVCTLKECHWNGHEINRHYDFCFTDVCTRDDYYCINGNGYTLHICGTMPSCKKRFRNVAEYDSTNPGYVDVYSVLCPDGYLQFNSGNCFNPCIKDDAVVVIRNSTTEKHALGYCNSEDNKCNKKGLTVFELASENDECSTEESKCHETSNLLPNCTCSPRCRSDQTRSFSSNFMCQSHSYVTASPSILTKITSHSSSQKPDITTSENHKVTKDYRRKMIVIVPVTVIVIVVLLALMFLIYKVCRRDRTENGSRHTENGVPSGYSGVPVMELPEYGSERTGNGVPSEFTENGSVNTANGSLSNRTENGSRHTENGVPSGYSGVPVMELPEYGSERTGNGVPSEFTDNGSVNTANGSLSRPIRKLVNKTEINGKTYTITADNVYINGSNFRPNVASEELDRTIDDRNDEQRMDILKLPNETQSDSGISSNEQTSVKKPYSS